MNYFADPERVYDFFHEVERFFAGEVKDQLKWGRSPWEKVGCLDLVKCPTIPSWTDLKSAQRHHLIENCKGYLEKQLEQYAPRIIIAYGRDVGKWFEKKWRVQYKPFETAPMPLGNMEVQLLFVPQKQGSHSEPEILRIREKIVECLRTLNLES
jgi:hypothetical protein